VALDVDIYQTTFLFYAPASHPQGWNLELDAFGEALSSAFTDVTYATVEGRSPRLDFSALTEDGFEYAGFATVESRDCVLVEEVDPDEASTFALWLRDTFVPAPDLVRFNSRAALELGHETDWRLPATGDHARVADEFKHHIRVIEGL
jgi:hypothetical protein